MFFSLFFFQFTARKLKIFKQKLKKNCLKTNKQIKMLQSILFAAALLCSSQLLNGAVVEQDICTECEQILGTIHLVLSNNATETEVLAAMAQVCSFLPKEYAGLVGFYCIFRVYLRARKCQGNIIWSEQKINRKFSKIKESVTSKC